MKRQRLWAYWALMATTILLVQLPLMAYTKLYREISRKWVDSYFGFHLSQTSWDKMTQKNEQGELVVVWPISDINVATERSFNDYLIKMGVPFREKMFPSQWDEKKYNWELTSDVWDKIPSDIPLADSVRQLLEWENHFNQMSNPNTRKAPRIFKLQHFEVPLSLVNTIENNIFDKKSYADPLIKSAIERINERGEKVVCWPINPEDRSYYSKLAKFLVKNKIDPEKIKKTRFYGMLMASQSLMVLDPETKKVWSVDVSTDNSGGNQKDRKVDHKQSMKARLASDHVRNVAKKVTYFFMKPLYDTLAYSIEKIDQSFIVREYPEEFISGNVYYLPNFSIINNKEGKRVAEINQSKNPAVFWRQNFNIPLSRATAEMSIYHGLGTSNNSSEQYLLELNRDLIPTGKIVIRDLGDSLLFEDYFSKKIIVGNKELLSHWPSDSIHEKLRSQFTLFRSQWAPSWIFDKDEAGQLSSQYSMAALEIPNSGSEVDTWKKSMTESQRKGIEKMMKLREEKWALEYFYNFQRTFKIYTGINLSAIVKEIGANDEGSADNVLTRMYPVKHIQTGLGAALTFQGRDHFIAYKQKFLSEYIDMAPCFQGALKTEEGRVCQDLLLNLYKKVRCFSRKCDKEFSEISK